MATVTVDLTTNQVIGAKDHFGTQDNVEALALFREWVSKNTDSWYVDYQKKLLAKIEAELINDPAKVLSTLQYLGLA